MVYGGIEERPDMSSMPDGRAHIQWGKILAYISKETQMFGATPAAICRSPYIIWPLYFIYLHTYAGWGNSIVCFQVFRSWQTELLSED